MSDKLVLNITLKDPALIEIPKWAIPTLGKLKDARIKVSIEKYRKQRSHSQLGYYWAVVVPAIQEKFIEAGNSVDMEDTHDYLKGEVGKLSKIIVLPTGEVKKIPGSTKILSTMGFEEYLEKCRFFALETFGIAIALPNQELEVSA